MLDETSICGLETKIWGLAVTAVARRNDRKEFTSVPREGLEPTLPSQESGF